MDSLIPDTAPAATPKQAEQKNLRNPFHKGGFSVTVFGEEFPVSRAAFVSCAVEVGSPFNCAAGVPLLARGGSNILLMLEPELCCGWVKRWILLLLYLGSKGR